MVYKQNAWSMTTTFLAMVFCLCCCPIWGMAQIDDELRGLYQKMIPQFSGELKTKLQNALENDQDYIELDASQFMQFRDHPANPFDGYDSIDASKITGIIRLQFETQPVRSRKPSSWERQSESQLAVLEPAAAEVFPSTVKIIDGDKQLCYGIIVKSNGLIVTKLSEIQGAEKLLCKLYDGRVLEASIINRNRENDLALVQVDATNLKPIEWAQSQPKPGTFLVSATQEGNAMAMGVYSHVPRSLLGKNQAYIGIKPQKHPVQGLTIVEVSSGGPAAKARLQIGDILLAIDGEDVDSVTALVNAIRARRPGQTIVVDIQREGARQQLEVVLEGRTVSSDLADRLHKMNKFGAIPSKRRSEFPLVFQHDTPLLPEQCGGPIIDLDGNVVGLNIARSGRIASYAIPANHMVTLVDKLVAPAIAENDSLNIK